MESVCLVQIESDTCKHMTEQQIITLKMPFTYILASTLVCISRRPSHGKPFDIYIYLNKY